MTRRYKRLLVDSRYVLHALNTSVLGVAWLKARFCEHFGRTPSYCACLKAIEIEAIQPLLICVTYAEIGG